MTKAGIATMKAYPGPPSDDRSVLYGFYPGYCKMSGKPIAVRIYGYRRIPPNERAFIKALQSGPIAVNLNVNQDFADYKGGILELEDCPPRSMKVGGRHCALLVGYGTDKQGRKFWKLMNTMGWRWGEFGYGRLRRSDHPHGVAGITEQSAFRPILGRSTK